MRLLAVGGAVAAREQRQHVIDLLGVVLRLRAAAAAAGASAARSGASRAGPRWRTAAGCSSPFGGRGRPPTGRPPDRAADQRRSRCLRPRRPPERPRPRSNRPGYSRVEQAELLDRGQRRAVAHLHRAGAEPDRRRGRRGQREHHRRARCRPPRVEVVLGEPVAGVAERSACGPGRCCCAAPAPRSNPTRSGSRSKHRQRRACHDGGFRLSQSRRSRRDGAERVRARGGRAASSRCSRPGTRRVPAAAARPGRRTGPARPG